MSSLILSSTTERVFIKCQKQFPYKQGSIHCQIQIALIDLDQVRATHFALPSCSFMVIHGPIHTWHWGWSVGEALLLVHCVCFCCIPTFGCSVSYCFSVSPFSLPGQRHSIKPSHYSLFVQQRQVLCKNNKRTCDKSIYFKYNVIVQTCYGNMLILKNEVAMANSLQLLHMYLNLLD